MKSVQDLAAEWLHWDKDDQTRGEIQRLLDAGDEAQLEKRLRDRISFGTAGLRARMEAGFSRLNSLTIIQASQGLAEYLLSVDGSSSKKGIVIGHDARHNSELFAKRTAAVFAAKGFKVWWYETLVHTPLVPFGVSYLGAAAGVMVTASHNPAQDNGYKVYWSNGCQIIPPHDSAIAKSILANLEPVTWHTTLVDSENPLVEKIASTVKSKYLDAVSSLAKKFEPLAELPYFVYTPMHGVGLPFMNDVLEMLPIKSKKVDVEAQALPDPDFPTVKFPNPEEHGALDLAMQTANKHGISMIIATDPDADRLAVAIKSSGQWHQLSGNQLGILFAAYLLETQLLHLKLRQHAAMLCSAVSTGMLRVIADKEGFQFEETLTGFKWLGNRAIALREKGFEVPFAFEEAIGYMFSDVVFDKDAISSAAVFLLAAAWWRVAEDVDPWQKMVQLYKKYGYFETENTYLVSPSPAMTRQVFADIRQLSGASAFPPALGAQKIVRWRDLTTGYDSATPDNKPVLPVDESSDMITVELEGGVKFTVRGSGTEPKIKLYIECRADSSEQARAGALATLHALLTEWFKPDVYGLRLANT